MFLDPLKLKQKNTRVLSYIGLLAQSSKVLMMYFFGEYDFDITEN